MPKAPGRAADRRSEREDAIVTGVFVDVDKPEYTEQYAGLVEAAAAAGRLAGMTADAPRRRLDELPLRSCG